MIAGLFVVGEALIATGVAAALGAWLAKAGRGSEVRLIALLMVVVATVGSFMSSTGIVAIFIPVVLGIVAQTGFSRGRLMMPLSVAALISGLMTLIATAPNLVVSSALAERGLKPLAFFELTPIGIVILVVGIAYMVTVGRRLLTRPETQPEPPSVSVAELATAYGLAGTFRALRVGSDSPLAGLTVAEAQVRTRFGVTLVAIIRQRGREFGVSPALDNMALRRGDLIAVTAECAAIDAFVAANDLMEEAFDERLRLAAVREVGLAEVMLAPDAPLIGKTLRQAAFRRRRGLTVLAIKRRGTVIGGNLIDTKLKFGDLILVAGGWDLIARLQAHAGEFVVLRLPEELKAIAPKRTKARVALAIVAAMVAIMTFGLLPNVIAVLLAALAVVGTGCVDGKAAYRGIGWSTVVLIAGMLPLATALEKTGLTESMAAALTQALADVGPYGMLAVLFLVTSVVGLFISNTVTALLIAPVAIGAAQDLGVSPHAFAVTVAVAASCAFVTPVSSPVNTLVLEPGRYRFVDFVKVGLPLLALSLIITVIMVGILYPLSPPAR
jgi:di/tricarboxylate transporter